MTTSQTWSHLPVTGFNADSSPLWWSLYVNKLEKEYIECVNLLKSGRFVPCEITCRASYRCHMRCHVKTVRGQLEFMYKSKEVQTVSIKSTDWVQKTGNSSEYVICKANLYKTHRNKERNSSCFVKNWNCRLNLFGFRKTRQSFCNRKQRKCCTLSKRPYFTRKKALCPLNYDATIK